MPDSKPDESATNAQAKKDRADADAATQVFQRKAASLFERLKDLRKFMSEQLAEADPAEDAGNAAPDSPGKPDKEKTKKLQKMI